MAENIHAEVTASGGSARDEEIGGEIGVMRQEIRRPDGSHTLVT